MAVKKGKAIIRTFSDGKQATRESFEKDGGPFWYFSKHGVGPGTLPKGVNVVETKEDDNYGTYIALDKVLDTKELKEYELVEKKPEEKLSEDFTHFEFTSGANPYIAKTEEDVNKMLTKYEGKVTKVKDGFYKIDDKEKDLFMLDESLFESSEEDEKPYTYKQIFNELKVATTNFTVDGDTYRYGHKSEAEHAEKILSKHYNSVELDKYGSWFQIEFKDLKKSKKSIEEAFKPSSEGIQSVKCYNQYGYTRQELRIDNDKRTFERGNFTIGKPDKKTKNRQEFEDIVDSLKELGYTEIDSDYQSMRNKSRKGEMNEASKLPRNATKIIARVGHDADRNMTKDDFGWKDDESGHYISPNDLRAYYDIEVLETDPNYKSNRTKPEYVVQGNYGYGWDDLTSSSDYKEAKADLRDYRENELNASHRLITRRVPVDESLEESEDNTEEINEFLDTKINLDGSNSAVAFMNGTTGNLHNKSKGNKSFSIEDKESKNDDDSIEDLQEFLDVEINADASGSSLGFLGGHSGDIENDIEGDKEFKEDFDDKEEVEMN